MKNIQVLEMISDKISLPWFFHKELDNELTTTTTTTPTATTTSSATSSKISDIGIPDYFNIGDFAASEIN